jgi:YggT family protein
VDGGVIGFVLLAVQIYIYIIIVRVLLSWLPAPRNEVFRSVHDAIYRVTEPYLGLFRRILPSIGLGGVGIDFSPFIAIVVLILIQSLLRNAV